MDSLSHGMCGSHHSRCAYMIHKWSLKDSDLCGCEQIQITEHIVGEYPLHQFPRGTELVIPAISAISDG